MENPPSSIPMPPLQQPPPLPLPSQGVDFGPLEFVLGFIAIIAIPLLMYTFILSIKCSTSSSNRSSADDARSRSSGDIRDAVSTRVKYQKESGECPVCLSAFSEDEEVKQLSACKHAFHTSCIDLWLRSHSNCPVCRASIAVKRPSTTSSGGRDADLQQGLPDSTSLV